ncbi:hypothetical protein [Hydrogenophaga defluvii]|uniref:Uncharacterized protein n=1 Tax=Hydrogenophaga defluvii TaxID=249410 RepID=A0ABW2SJB7_9BURK
MTSVIPLAGRSAAASPLPSTPELIGLHGMAENALATALHELRRLDGTADSLRLATARATRAGTLLRRACESLNTLEG